jgi:hypothetical protein
MNNPAGQLLQQQPIAADCYNPYQPGVKFPLEARKSSIKPLLMTFAVMRNRQIGIA